MFWSDKNTLYLAWCSGDTVYQLPIAAIINYYKHSDLKPESFGVLMVLEVSSLKWVSLD